MSEDRDLLREIVDLHLVQGKTKQEIEKLLIGREIIKIKRRGTAEPKKQSSKHVAELMAKAAKLLLEGEEQYYASQNDSVDRKLSEAVRTRCKLLDVIIPTYPAHRDATPLEETAHLCRFSADYVSRQIQLAENQKKETWVMMGGGNESFYTARFLEERRRPFTRFAAYAVIGRGFDPHSTHIGPESNLTYAWIRSGMIPGHLYYATATPPPPAPKDMTPKDVHAVACNLVHGHTEKLLKDSPQIAYVHKVARGNILVGGFGLVTTAKSHNHLTMASVLNQYGIDMNLLRSEDATAAGDFCYAIYDHDGVGHDEWEFLLTAGYPHSVAFLKNMATSPENKVIGVGGFDRLPAIKAALKGKLFNVLITDKKTGEALLADPAPRKG
jgi:hypothetical protein